MSEREGREAFVTLATNDTYSLGCLVLGNSLKRVRTTRQLVVMVTDGVSNSMRSQLAQVFDVIQEVNVLDSNDPINLSLLGRPDLNVTFTKLHCWRLTQFDKAVFLDADTLVLQNVDELFDREELSAAPDAGWPDCFNSGVFVYKPSLETYESLLQFATSQGSFDGGDQGLLNMYFNKWATEDISKHLPFIYNVVSQAFYSYLPAFTQFKDRVKIVHFIGAVKPWHHTYDTSTRTVTPLPGTGHSQEFLQVWWNIFMDMVQPTLDPTLRDELTRTLFAPWPPPPPEQEHNKEDHGSHENVDNRPLVIEETVPVMFPYKPPDVDHENDKNNSEKMENNVEETITEIIVIPRSYSELESHYAEEPISHINPSDPPPAIYSAPWITEGWEKGTKGPDPNPPGYTNVHHKSSESKPEALNSDQESKEISINEARENESSSPTSSVQDTSIGLVGELATMSIQGSQPPPSPVSDAQRKLNWERGQIDYLGQDSFENIQRKIDETLNNTDKGTAPVGIATPFATKFGSDPKLAKNQQTKPQVESKKSEPVKQAAVKTVPEPKVMSTVKPQVSEKPTGPAPGSTKLIEQAQGDAKPAVPTPISIKSTASAPVSTKPTVPAPVGAKPTIPPAVGKKPTVPAPGDAKPAVPTPISVKSTASVPVASKLTLPAPVGAKPAMPVQVGAKPTLPAQVGAKSTAPPPVGAKPTSPPPVSAKPTFPAPGQSRFGATPGSTSVRGPAPPTQSRPGATSATTRSAAPSQPGTKTSGLNIQTSSKKK